ncbi:MAG: tetraacyldisaccharide 4'-kinase [Candidatus Omnitrophota bacterium]
MALTVKERIKKYLFEVISAKQKDPLSSLLKGLLLLLSLIYKMVQELRLFFYEHDMLQVHHSKTKVISVGNITVGGTGKTPLVEFITGYLLQKKRNVAIISRGYKQVSTENGVKADETEMLKQIFPKVPVIINSDRLAAIKDAVDKYEAECVVLDDAFQNLKVYKDVNIVCIDCTNPFGNYHLLPRGLLRMPFSYLRRADIIVLTRQDQGKDNTDEIIKKVFEFNSKAMICKSRHVPKYIYNIIDKAQGELAVLKGKKVALLCGIANPESFTQTMKSIGADVAAVFAFPDHHNYTTDDLAECFRSCQKKYIKTVVTTAKDETKLKAILNENDRGIEIFVLKIKLEMEENEKRFFGVISDLFTA